MGNEARKAGAEGRRDTPMFDPDRLILVEDEKHPLYDPRVHLPIDEAVVHSMMEFGVLQDVIVRISGKNEDGSWRLEVVDGRQRVKHAREANRRLRKLGKEPILVGCRTRRESDVDLLGIAMLANLQRTEETPLSMAHKVSKYMAMGRSEKDVARVLGKSGQTIKNWLALLDCHEAVQKAVEKGKIPATLASSQLVRLPREEQPAALKALLEAGTVKGDTGLAAADGLRRGEKPDAGDAKKRRMRSRLRLEKWKKSLPKDGGREIAVARAVLGYVLGQDRALKDYPALAKTLEEA